uniref:Putative polyprotein n=1 Tax=HVAC-associated RNA virus 1 TaxID=2083425 RepID=A0A2L1GHH7_9VIRU|nr:putative polyprotein [HVAC-associated RNA virus 1]
MSSSGEDGSPSPSQTKSPINSLQERIQELFGAKSDYYYPLVTTYEREDNGSWGCELRSHNHATYSQAKNKRLAKEDAYTSFLVDVTLDPNLLCADPLRIDTPDSIPFNPNPRPTRALLTHFMHASVSEQLFIASKISSKFKRPVYVYLLDNPPKNLVNRIVSIDNEPFRYAEDPGVPDGPFYVLSRTSQKLYDYERVAMYNYYLSFPNTYESSDRCKITLAAENANILSSGDIASLMYDCSLDGPVTPNVASSSSPRETPIEPVAQIGVQDNPGTQTIPHLPNPQPTAVTPAMAMQDPSLVSALEPLMPHELLNPIGPPNMLGVGGVTFDIKDLIYSQYLDNDIYYTFTDSGKQGDIIFQIPYDPTSDYVNPYIRQWLNLHPRYTGALNFRFTVVGNSTFSGLIGFAWYPRQINATNVKVSEMMKYSYTTMGINEPSNRIFTLFDARQSLFWRDTNDAPGLNPAPVLVAFIYMTAESPLREGITVRIRVASKLSAGEDGPPFVASEPTLIASTPGVGTPSPTGVDQNYISILAGMPLVPVIARPILLNNPIYCTIDGTAFKPYVNVSKAGDRIIDQLGGWNNTPGNNSSSFIGSAFQTTSKETPLVNYHGIYIIDISQARPLTVLGTDSSTIGVNPIISQFYATFDELESFDPAVAVTTSKDLTQVGAILAPYCKVFQYATFLPPTSTGKASFTYFPSGDTTKPQIVPYNALQLLIYYTDAGPVSVAYIRSASPFPVKASFADSFLMRSFFNDPQIAITQITSITPYKGWVPENMPAGWRNFAVTGDVPFVAAPGVTTYQNYNHESVQSIFTALSITATPTQVIEIDLSDLDSGSIITTVRYLPDRQCPVINLGTDSSNWLTFASLIRPSSRLYISRIATVERSNTFPITQITNFASNTLQSTQTLRNASAAYNPNADGPIHSNAAGLLGAGFQAAGGLWQGIGSGLGALGSYYENKENRDWLEKMYGLNSNNMFKMQENQNSFLSALSRQNSSQQLFNSMQMLGFQAELGGYRTPGSISGQNRAGQLPGQSLFARSGYLPPPTVSTAQTVSGGRFSEGTQTPISRTESSGVQNVPTTASASTQTPRPPGQANPSPNNVGTQYPDSPLRRAGAMRLKQPRRNPHFQNVDGVTRQSTVV